MPKPINPPNVPTGGDMSYAALAAITPAQLRFISKLRRLCGNPPTWEQDCSTILGGFDGPPETLSRAAGSYLITTLQAGLLATREPGDDLQLEDRHV